MHVNMQLGTLGSDLHEKTKYIYIYKYISEPYEVRVVRQYLYGIIFNPFLIE